MKKVSIAALIAIAAAGYAATGFAQKAGVGVGVGANVGIGAGGNANSNSGSANSNVGVNAGANAGANANGASSAVIEEEKRAGARMHSERQAARNTVHHTGKRLSESERGSASGSAGVGISGGASRN